MWSGLPGGGLKQVRERDVTQLGQLELWQGGAGGQRGECQCDNVEIDSQVALVEKHASLSHCGMMAVGAGMLVGQ